MGFRALTLQNEDTGLLLTLTADWRREFSADGRADDQTAAALVLSGVHEIPAPAENKTTTKNVVHIDEERLGKFLLKGRPRDLLELTTFTQVVDATLDAPIDVVARIAADAVSHQDGGNRDQVEYANDFLSDILEDLDGQG